MSGYSGGGYHGGAGGRGRQPGGGNQGGGYNQGPGRATRSRSPEDLPGSGGRGRPVPRHPDGPANPVYERPQAHPALPPSVPTPDGARDIPYKVLEVRGTVGERFMAETNHHVIRCLPTKPIWAYDLKIVIPDDSAHKGTNEASVQQRARVLLKNEVLDFLGEHYVFDGVSQVWSPSTIVPEGQSRKTLVEMEKRRDGKPNNIEVTISNKGKLNVGALAKHMIQGQIELNPAGNVNIEDPIKWLQAVFRKTPASRLVTRPNSNAYFDRNPMTTMALRSTAGVLEARRGVFQTMQIRFGRLTMNIDTTTTPFWVPNVCLLNFTAALMGTQVNRLLDAYKNPGNFRTQCSKLCGIYFHVKHLGERGNSAKLKMKSFSNTNAIDTKFEERMDDGSTASTNVSDYFQKKYNIRLQYPQLPLVSTSKGDFPLEVCFSADGERYKELLQGAETADFIKFATAPAAQRKAQINHNLRMLAHHNNATLKAHGIVMEPAMMKMKARMLPAPKLIYGQRRNMMPREGKWNLRGLQFLKPSAIRSWVIVYLPFRQPMDEKAIDTFGAEMVRQFRACGMTVPQQGPALLVGNPQGHMATIVDEACQKARSKFNADPNVIFFVLQGASTQIYQLLKMGLDVKKGIASQVMLQEKAFSGKGTQQYIANIAMKVNVKLGGTNCIAEEPMFSAAPCMLMGGDISHASPGALRAANPPPSCAALVGTWDKECTAYTAVTSMQESTLGMIANIKPMFAELLKRYAEKNAGKYPGHIIYYRDGVSESEFDSIKMQEGRLLKDLLLHLKQQTKIAVIVAIKRHHTRFFADPPMATRLGNVPPGTVIENSGTLNDAYIIAHPDLQGTKRPTRYVSIVDENNLAPDVFQRLSFNLCSSYARATTSVAVCPPIYYADQACERARLHLQLDKQTGATVLGPVHKNLEWNMWWQ